MFIDEINIKLVIFGDAGIGKTSIINSYLNKSLPERYIPTIGSNISRKEYQMKDYLIRSNIFDIGGQRSFNPLNPVYFNNVDIALLVFDLTKPKESLLELQKTYLKKLTENSEDCLSYLIGNKLDLISTENDLKYVTDRFSIKEIPLIFLSAKTHHKVEDLFELSIFNFLQDWEEQIEDKSKKLSDEFLGFIGKNENNLNELFINLTNIDLHALKKKSNTMITKKVSVPVESDIELSEISKDAQYPNLDAIKENVINAYSNNLSAIQDIILNLKNTPIALLNESIDKSSNELNFFKEDFELKLQSILKLEKEEINKK